MPIQPQQQQQPDQAMVAELERLAAAKANLEGEVSTVECTELVWRDQPRGQCSYIGAAVTIEVHRT